MSHYISWVLLSGNETQRRVFLQYVTQGLFFYTLLKDNYSFFCNFHWKTMHILWLDTVNSASLHQTVWLKVCSSFKHHKGKPQIITRDGNVSESLYHFVSQRKYLNQLLNWLPWIILITNTRVYVPVIFIHRLQQVDICAFKWNISGTHGSTTGRIISKKFIPHYCGESLFVYQAESTHIVYPPV